MKSKKSSPTHKDRADHRSKAALKREQEDAPERDDAPDFVGACDSLMAVFGYYRPGKAPKGGKK